jgi:hypothetical protein
MAGKARILYLLYGEGYFFSPWGRGRVVSDLQLTRQDYYSLRIQAVTSPDFLPNSDGTAPASVCVDLSQYSTGNFALYTIPDWRNGFSSTAVAAWSGLDASDLPWYAPASGRLSFIVTPTSAIAPKVYVAQFALASGTPDFRMPDIPMLVDLRQELSLGTEPGAPAIVSGTATINSGQSSVTVTGITGMASTGLVYPFWLGTPQSTGIGATCGTTQFTITASGPMPANTTVGWFIVKNA